MKYQSMGGGDGMDFHQRTNTVWLDGSTGGVEHQCPNDGGLELGHVDGEA